MHRVEGFEALKPVQSLPARFGFQTVKPDFELVKLNSFEKIESND